MKEEMDKRVGELQLKNVENVSVKQSAEREVNSIKLKVEREQSEYKMEIERLKSEFGAVRARLKFAEDTVVKGRRKNLQMVKAVASLETDLVKKRHMRENAEKRKLEEVARIKEDKTEELEKLRCEKQNKEKRLKRDNEQLLGTVIGKLKSQLLEVTNKF